MQYGKDSTQEQRCRKGIAIIVRVHRVGKLGRAKPTEVRNEWGAER